MGVPRIPDWDTLNATDMNGKTGERKSKTAGLSILNNIKASLRAFDQQDAIGRYTWHNLPGDLTGQFIETILYYKGQGALFYLKEENKFYFLPYCLDGTIDVYGRYTSIKPLPFTGKSETDKEVFIPGLMLKPQYSVPMPEDLNEEIFNNSCVILHDYPKQYSQKVIPRKDLQESIIQVMAECIPLARTALVANSGVRTIKVDDPDQGWIVQAASNAIYNGAISDIPEPLIPLASEVQIEDLTSAGSALKSEEYLLMMQGIDNFRLSLYGLKNGGLFQKKAHMLEAEQEMNDGNIGIIYQAGLTLRQRFCDIVNAIWGLGIWCEASEAVIGIDRDADMMIGDNEDQSGLPGEQMAGDVNTVGGDNGNV